MEVGYVLTKLRYTLQSNSQQTTRGMEDGNWNMAEVGELGILRKAFCRATATGNKSGKRIVGIGRFLRIGGGKEKGFLQDLLDFIVQHKHESTASTTEHVGEGTLEEGTAALLFGNGRPAVEGALVHNLGLGTSRLHHHATTDGIEGIGHNTGNGGHDLRDSPADVEWSGLGVRQHTTGSVVEAEVGSTVDDDTWR